MKQETLVLSHVLYGKTVDGNIKYWKIKLIGFNNIVIEYGALNGTPMLNIVTCKNPSSEAKKRYTEKYNKGYRSTEHLGGCSTFELDTMLPNVVLDKNNCFKAMLCKTFKQGKDEWPRYAQPKVNGLRGTDSFEFVEIGVGMFAAKKVESVFRSREGMTYVLPILSKAMEDALITESKLLNFDGELYIPGAPLNVIKSAVPYINEHGTVSKSNDNTDKVQYWMFDLAIPDYSQEERTAKLMDLAVLCNNHSITKLSKNPHQAMELAKRCMGTEKRIFILNGMMIESDDMAIWYRNQCIAAGFEGCVFRDLNAEYAFGQRPQTITKFKKFKQTECMILDVIDEGDNDNGESIKFYLRNDINSETFKCSISASFDIRKQLLYDKHLWIGKYATVEYGERSGVKKCPFHCNVIAWDRAGSGDLDITKLNKE